MYSTSNLPQHNLAFWNYNTPQMIQWASIKIHSKQTGCKYEITVAGNESGNNVTDGDKLYLYIHSRYYMCDPLLYTMAPIRTQTHTDTEPHVQQHQQLRIVCLLEAQQEHCLLLTQNTRCFQPTFRLSRKRRPLCNVRTTEIYRLYI